MNKFDSLFPTVGGKAVFLLLQFVWPGPAGVQLAYMIVHRPGRLYA